MDGANNALLTTQEKILVVIYDKHIKACNETMASVELLFQGAATGNVPEHWEERVSTIDVKPCALANALTTGFLDDQADEEEKKRQQHTEEYYKRMNELVEMFRLEKARFYERIGKLTPAMGQFFGGSARWEKLARRVVDGQEEEEE